MQRNSGFVRRDRRPISATLTTAVEESTRSNVRLGRSLRLPDIHHKQDIHVIPASNPFIYPLHSAEADLRILFPMFEDYSEWIQLQNTAGGLPANFIGYLAMLLVKLIAFHDVRCPDAMLPSLPATGKHLDPRSIPLRHDRPQMFRWPVPQRQHDQHPSAEQFLALQQQLEKFISTSSAKGIVIEKGTAFDSLNAYYLDRHELFHVHPVDKSFHCMLDPCDSKLLILKGWAEWFGLAGKVGQGKGTVLFYAPRNAAERNVLERVWQASVQHAEAMDKKA
jgi:hypothetical protein